MDICFKIGFEIWGLGRSYNVSGLRFEFSCEHETLFVHVARAVSLDFWDIWVLGFTGLSGVEV